MGRVDQTVIAGNSNPFAFLAESQNVILLFLVMVALVIFIWPLFRGSRSRR